MKNYNKLTAIKDLKAFEDLISTLSYNSLKEINGIIQAYEDKRIDITDDNGDYIRDQEIVILDSTYKETGMELTTLRWYCEYEEIDYMIDNYKEAERDETIIKIKTSKDKFNVGQIISLSLKEIYHSSFLELEESYNSEKKCYFKETFYCNQIEYDILMDEYYDLWTPRPNDYLALCDGEKCEIINIDNECYTLKALDDGREFKMTLAEICVGYFEVEK